MARAPLRIGLTGGIATGKSTVAAAFADRDVPVFSADDIAHELTGIGAPLLTGIHQAFGSAVFNDDGSLDRRALADRVFTDAAARERLERLLHPPIREALRARVAACDAEYCILEIPLLHRRDVGTLVDRVLVVDIPPAEQIRRLRARDDIDSERAERVLAAQPDRESRLALADDVFVNGDREGLEAEVERLHDMYLDIARRGDPGRPGRRPR